MPAHDPLTVVHVIRSAGTGGVESHVRSLLELMQQRGGRPALVSLAAGPPHQQFVELGCPITTLTDRPSWGWRTIGCMWHLRRTLRRLSPDIVHLHGARPIFIGSLAARLAGIRGTVCSLHGAHNLMAMREDGTASRLGNLFARVVHGVGFLLCRRIFICAERLRGDVRTCLETVTAGHPSAALEKVRVVHLGIDPGPFDNGAPRSVDGAGSLVIGTLCRLDEPKKGVRVLLQAAAELEKQGIRVALRIAGEGHSRTMLERAARDLQLDDCRFLGFVDDAAAFYATLDVFVLPSFSEGFPLVNLEAMAAGIPVVTTDVGGAAEAVLDNECGYVVPPGDPEALAAALRRLAADPGRRRTFGAAGALRVRQQFSLSVMFSRLLAVYAEVQPRGGPPLS
jgi:glycosyltransferase involved in cell wall biosynthesis